MTTAYLCVHDNELGFCPDCLDNAYRTTGSTRVNGTPLTLVPTPVHISPPADETEQVVSMATPNEEPAVVLPYVDIAALLAGDLPQPPPPALLTRTDGNKLLYAGRVNVLYGDPECGKTWIALAAITEALAAGQRCAFLDLDHNGPTTILSRLFALGATRTQLLAGLLCIAEPEDRTTLLAVIDDLTQWQPAIVVVDSIGELMPLLDLSSNIPDEYTMGHRRTLSRLATAGACVVAIDHMPKSDEARAKGQIGAGAKKRAINGVIMRVDLAQAFAPGRGGVARMRVEKDRDGRVREHCPADGTTPAAGRFVLTAHPDGTSTWKIDPPLTGTGTTGADIRLGGASRDDDDMAELMGLNPPPRSKRDIQERTSIKNATRACAALRRFRELTQDIDER